MTATRPGIDAQRARIRDATRALLAQSGLEQISAVSIADRAKVSRATFYRAYPSIEAVMEALYDEYHRHVTDRLATHLSSSEANEQWLTGLIEAVIADAVESRHVLVAMLREELNPSSQAREARSRRIDTQVEFISDWWQRTTSLPPDRELIQLFVLLLQMVGLHVAMNPDLGAAARERLRQSCTFLVDSTVSAYRNQIAG